jgi:hypothetical protein
LSKNRKRSHGIVAHTIIDIVASPDKSGNLLF